MGYKEVVVVGHSAGGLLARHLVEDCPDVGVTKVVQVCTPNGGSDWAKVQFARGNQRRFMDSLTKEARQKSLWERKDKTIPKDVEFVCLVGTGLGDGDGVVARSCQWSEDLRKQGIPAVPVKVNHRDAMRTERGAEAIVEAIRGRQARWDADQVKEGRRKVLDD
jgi:pimeloyl-ACP methyl ester carboxylesterase